MFLLHQRHFGKRNKNVLEKKEMLPKVSCPLFFQSLLLLFFSCCQVKEKAKNGERLLSFERDFGKKTKEGGA